MPQHVIADSTTGGYPTVTLTCLDPAVDATFAPTLGMIGCSLRHRGAELLGRRGGLVKYAASGSTMGIPLLHPWANRLSGFAYTVADTTVTIDPQSPRLHRDGNGLPMHGVLAAYPGWRVTARAADATSARLSAVLDFGADPALLAAFPFPHTFALDVTLRGATLTIATTLRPTAAVAVPVAFGFHPYLQLPDIVRADWHVEAPVRRRLRLDARMMPTGESEAIAIEPGRLGSRAFDDLFTDLDRPTNFVLAGGGRRITVAFDEGYRYAQLYAPAAEPLICFEPMTAPTNALVSGDGLLSAEPGAEYRAAFSIAIECSTVATGVPAGEPPRRTAEIPVRTQRPLRPRRDDGGTGCLV
jgi:galactose mutarotase-like enzyme